jgi:branched-chain amino acid transport system substrate-binding protein
MKQYILYLVLITTCLIGCNKREEDVIKIGAILPLTGRLAVMGEVERNAMLLAQEEVNRENKKIEIIFEDGKGNPTDAVTAARKLIDIERADILLTSTTGASLAVEPIATERKKNLIAFCMDPDVAARSEYVIRYYEGIDEEASAIIRYFEESQIVKNVGILYAKIPVWEGGVNNKFVPFFKNKKLMIRYNESYPIGENDFRSWIVKLRNGQVDHLVLLGYGFEYPNIFKSLSEYGLVGKIQIIGGWGFLYTQVDPRLLEGVLVSGPEYVFKRQDLAGDFYEAYHKKYGTLPNFDAAFAYNVILSLGSNIQKSDTQRPLKQLFTKKGAFEGVVGSYYFSPEGNMIVATSLGEYSDGRITEYRKVVIQP